MMLMKMKLVIVAVRITVMTAVTTTCILRSPLLQEVAGRAAVIEQQCTMNE